MYTLHDTPLENPYAGMIAERPRAATVQTFAAPLMPLQDRDRQVLLELFMQEEIEEITADIAYNLLIRCPEPCWEDDSLEFL